MHAWYSKLMDDKYGHVIYAREDGSLVKCTDVCREKDTLMAWPDTQYVGEVSRWVSSHPKGGRI